MGKLFFAGIYIWEITKIRIISTCEKNAKEYQTNLYTLEIEQTNIEERVSEEAGQIVTKKIKIKSNHTK